MDKIELADKIAEANTRIQNVIADWEKATFQKKINNKWKVKDLIAHLLWYEEEMVQLLENKSLSTASPNWQNDFDERNRLIYNEMKGIKITEILERRTIAVNKIQALVLEMDQSYLENPDLFDGMPNEWIPWQIITQNTYLHYEDHLKILK